MIYAATWMWWQARVAVTLLSLGILSGCATSSLNLTRDEVNNIAIQDIVIRYKPDAYISWPSAEQAYVESVPDADKKKIKVATRHIGMQADQDELRKQELLQTAEAKSFIRDRLSQRVKDHLQRAVTYRYRGNRAVILELDVISFVIPHAVQRVVLGGNPMFGAYATLKDAKTGAVLGKLDRNAAAPAGQGVIGVLVEEALIDDSLEHRVIEVYAQNVLQWLDKAKAG